MLSDSDLINLKNLPCLSDTKKQLLSDVVVRGKKLVFVFQAHKKMQPN